MSEALKVFISYSRKNSAEADELAADLRAAGMTVLIDKRDLPFGEKWQGELRHFIEISDTTIWLVSPDSVGSEWCHWELREVRRNNKRLVPVVVGRLPVEGLPIQISEIHLLPASGVYERSDHLPLLLETLHQDHVWLKEHTRLADAARQWILRGQPAARLLRGQALRDAEAWRDRQPPKAPPPAPETRQWLGASRKAEGLRTRWITAGGVGLAVASVLVAAFVAVQWRIATAERDNALRQQAITIAGAAEKMTAVAMPKPAL